VKTLLLFAVFLLACAPPVFAGLTPFQIVPNSSAGSDPATVDAERTAREWFRRWNALDGSKEALTEYMELFRTDAEVAVSPREDRLGVSSYEGRDEIRIMAEDTSKMYKKWTYLIKARSVNEKTVDLLYIMPTPFGRTGVAVEFTGSYDVRKSGKRFLATGAAFFEVQGGKITRLRIYYAGGETGLEIVGVDPETEK
jgi:hypothetical protein